MTLRVLKDVAAVTMGRAPIRQRIGLTIMDDSDKPVPHGIGKLVAFRATLHHTTLIREHASYDEEQVVRRAALRAIARAIYGEVEDELREALRELWEDGQHFSPAARRLDALLVQLRGEDA